MAISQLNKGIFMDTNSVFGNQPQTLTPAMTSPISEGSLRNRLSPLNFHQSEQSLDVDFFVERVKKNRDLGRSEPFSSDDFLESFDQDIHFVKAVFSLYNCNFCLDKLSIPCVDFSQYLEELDKLTEILKKDPTNFDTLLRRAWCLLILGKFEEAEQEAMKIPKESPLYCFAKFLLDALSLDLNEFKNSLSERDLTSPFLNGDPVSLFIKSNAFDKTRVFLNFLLLMKNIDLITNEQFEKVSPEFLDLLEKNDPDLLGLKALIFLSLKRYKDAENVAIKLNSICKDYPIALAILGRTSQSSKKYVPAAMYYARVLGHERNNKSDLILNQKIAKLVVFNFIICSKKLGQIDVCLQNIQALEMINHEDVHFHILKSLIYLETQLFNKALESIEPIASNNPLCIEIKCRALFMLKRYRELGLFFKLINKNDLTNYTKDLLFIFICKYQAEKLFNLARYDEALEICNTILKNQPNDFEVLSLKFNCLFNLNNYKDAVRSLDTAFQKPGSYLEIPSQMIFKFSECCIHLLDYEKGIDCLEEYQSFHPTCLELRKWLKNNLILQLTEKINLNPKDLDLKGCRAALYLLSAQFDKCSHDLRYIIKRNPEHFLGVITTLRKYLKLHQAHTEAYGESLPKLTITTKDEKKIIMIVHYLIAINAFDVARGMLSQIIFKNEGYALIFEAYIDLKKRDRKACLGKVIASYKYDFGDPDFYSKRGILSDFLKQEFKQIKSKLPKYIMFEPGHSLKDFEKALKLNPNHILTLRAIIPSLLHARQYERVLEILSKLETYYEQFSHDLLLHLSAFQKKVSSEERRENFEAINVFLKDTGYHFEERCQKYVEFYKSYLQTNPFTIFFNEWTGLGLGALKMWLEEETQQETRDNVDVKDEPSVRDIKAIYLIKHFIENLSKLPSVIKYEIEEREEMIIGHIHFDDSKILDTVKSACDQYQMTTSIEQDHHLKIQVFKGKKFRSARVQAFFKAVDEKLLALTSKNEPSPLPSLQTDTSSSFDFIQDIVQKGPRKKKGVVNKKHQKTLHIREKIKQKSDNRKIKKEKEKEKETEFPTSKPVAVEQKKKENKGKLELGLSVIEKNSQRKKAKGENEALEPIAPKLPLEGGRVYQKGKEEIVEYLKKNLPAIKPINAQTPVFSEIQLSNLKSAIKNLMALEDRVKEYFGSNPQLKTFDKSLRMRLRRAFEYDILRAFEAVDPTGKISFRDDPEYYAKMALSLGSLEEIRKIRNYLRSEFYSIRSKWVFRLAIELAKRAPSRTLKDLMESQKDFVKNPLTKTLNRLSSEVHLSKSFSEKFDNHESKERFLVAALRKEFEILKQCIKEEETFYTFSQLNQNLGTIKKCLSNIQKLSSLLSSDQFQKLKSHPKFEKIRRMGASIAHDIPEALPIGEEDEVSLDALFSAVYKDRKFFEEIFHLLESINTHRE